LCIIFHGRSSQGNALLIIDSISEFVKQNDTVYVNRQPSGNDSYGKNAAGAELAELADLAQELQNWKVAVTALSNCSTIRTQCPISHFEAFLRLARHTHCAR